MRQPNFIVFAALFFALVGAASPASARPGPDDHDRFDHDPRWEHHHDHWYRGDIVRFSEWDMPVWRGGYWHQGRRDGRDGWWWVVGSDWYYYPTPVYPYPDPFVPPGVVVETVPAASGLVYYCADPVGYYPYVQACRVLWQRTTPPRTVVTETVVTEPSVVPAPVPATAPVMADGVSQRQLDDRQLNAYASEFADIDLTGKLAKKKLSALYERVKAFRKSLYSRSYNAMDILKDAEDLQERIATAKAK